MTVSLSMWDMPCEGDSDRAPVSILGDAWDTEWDTVWEREGSECAVVDRGV